MIDLTPIQAWLTSLGPYGWLLAIAAGWLIPKGIDWLKARFPNLKLTPANPAAPNGPAPVLDPLNPADPLAGRPVLGLALVLLKQWLARNNPGKDSEAMLVGHLLGPVVGAEVIVPTPAERMTGPRLADQVPQ